MTPPRWVGKEALLVLHEESVARFGGASGLRDEGLLDSALARPRNAYAYDPHRSIAQLAASYAFGLVRNHPFVDGNKRAALLALGVFSRAQCLSPDGQSDSGNSRHHGACRRFDG